MPGDGLQRLRHVERRVQPEPVLGDGPGHHLERVDRAGTGECAEDLDLLALRDLVRADLREGEFEDFEPQGDAADILTTVVFDEIVEAH